MEVVEVTDFQCHSDGEEVVLLDLDKANIAEDSPEVHEMIVDVNGENGKDDSTNGIDIVMETCDDVSQQQQHDPMDINEIVKQIPDIDSVEGTCDNNSVQIDSDVSQASEMEMSIDLMEVKNKEEMCIEVVTEDRVEVVESPFKTNEIEEIDSNTNDTNESSIKVDDEVSKKSINDTTDNINSTIKAEDKTIVKASVTNETKNPDGSIVLTKDNKSVTIPQHIAGRDISSLTEESLSRSGKLMLKPRFGVKVPYIHMTSQIVTQDEIAKELFERFQQKYPLTRVDKPDKLIPVKLTHRLTNKISLKAADGKSKHNNKNSTKLTKKELSNKKSKKIAKNKLSNVIDIVDNSLSKIQSPEIELSNNVSNESLQINDSPHIDLITNTLQSLDQSADHHTTLAEAEDKNDEKISTNEELIAILEDFENIETADTNGNKVLETPKPLMRKKIIRSTTRTKRCKPKLDPEIEKQIALKQLQEVSRPKRFDSHYAKRKVENEKKALNKNDLGSVQKRKKSDDVPEVKIAIDHFIKSYTDKRQSTVKADPTSNDETISDNIIEVESVPKPNNVVKARTMREINRLLGDEGAINMIYSLEKRRSPGNNNSKNILPSTRRKKKDLMLKTKLVKNAMLKMSSPTTSSLSTNRLGRRSDVCTPSENKCTRKTSIDSQGSDQSIKCLGNFSGKTIPADESKIIRKHSSSSEASSVGGSPILPVPNAVSVNDLTTKHTPVKALRVYTRKNKISDDLLNSNDQSFNDVNKETNKSFVKTKNATIQKVKKQPVQVSSKMSRSLAENIKQEVEGTVYNEITIRRYDGVVHITLTPVSTIMKNALNVSVMEELIKELNNLENDDTCKVVLVSSAGRIFCQGLDIAPLIHDDAVKCKEAAVQISSTLKNFISCLSNFPKLLVAGVDGAAVGLGATMLVHFDLVFASDKATFETPYAQLGHIAEGAATTILGRLLVAEMIMGSQRLTAGQAHYYGLVTRTLWPDRFHDELIPLVKALTRHSLQVMKTSKSLQKQETKDKLAKALETETHILVEQWTGDECQQNLQAYLKDTVDNINT